MNSLNRKLIKSKLKENYNISAHHPYYGATAKLIMIITNDNLYIYQTHFKKEFLKSFIGNIYSGQMILKIYLYIDHNIFPEKMKPNIVLQLFFFSLFNSKKYLFNSTIR